MLQTGPKLPTFLVVLNYIIMHERTIETNGTI